MCFKINPSLKGLVNFERFSDGSYLNKSIIQKVKPLYIVFILLFLKPDIQINNFAVKRLIRRVSCIANTYKLWEKRQRLLREQRSDQAVRNRRRFHRHGFKQQTRTFLLGQTFYLIIFRQQRLQVEECNQSKRERYMEWQREMTHGNLR